MILLSAFKQAVLLIKAFEGCRLKAYQDRGGVWTIGWGETLGVQSGMLWSQGLADEVLEKRVWQFLLGVLQRCPQLWSESDEKLAACTSLAYNIGLGAFARSSVCRLTKRKEFTRAAESFLLWNKSAGAVDRILVLRRAKERRIFSTNAARHF